MTGWINALFPYIKKTTFDGVEGEIEITEIVRNTFMPRWQDYFRQDSASGPSLDEIPSSLVSAPLKLIDHRDGTEHAMRLVGGLVGVSEEPTRFTLEPEFGWAVVHET